MLKHDVDRVITNDDDAVSMIFSTFLIWTNGVDAYDDVYVWNVLIPTPILIPKYY